LQRRRALPAARRGCPAPLLIGLPVHVTVPKIRDIRWRYCSRWDETPAARLGRSLLRLGICRPEDWTGSAVDFVERGFSRFAKDHGVVEATRIWQGDVRIMDHLFELTERERDQAQADMDGPPQMLYLVADFDAAASIPIGPTLTLLERENPRLPAAFYVSLIHHLSKWMRVYDYASAHEYVEMAMMDMDEEQLADSFYPKVDADLPVCLKDRLKMSPARACELLKEIQPHLRGRIARQLVSYLLDVHNNASGRRHFWPYCFSGRIPGLEDYLEDSDGVGPGCLISWHDDDAISACFDEEMSYMGQNGPLAPSILLPFNLRRSRLSLDKQVRHVFGYAGAMLRSLAAAAKVVEIIRELYDEHLREHRRKSGLQTEPSATGVRDE
jgi:hypothetical protein